MARIRICKVILTETRTRRTKTPHSVGKYKEFWAVCRCPQSRCQGSNPDAGVWRGSWTGEGGWTFRVVRSRVECGLFSPLLALHQPLRGAPLWQPGEVVGASYQQCAQDMETLCGQMHLADEIHYILNSLPVGPGKLCWVGT